MAVALRLIVFQVVLTALLFVNAFTLKEENNEEIKELKSLRNSTMAESLEDFYLEHAVDEPEVVAAMVVMNIRNNTDRRKFGFFFSCESEISMDDCCRCNDNWMQNGQRLADCAIGFGRKAVDGRDGRYYVVTDPKDDDPVNPQPGILRHVVIQDCTLWIVLKRDRVIILKQEMIMNNSKTTDDRGANVHNANGACITIQFITNIINRSLDIHGCKCTGNAMIRNSPSHYGWRTMADGDGISIFGASHIWIDHNSLSTCADGHIDVIMGSIAITILIIILHITTRLYYWAITSRMLEIG